jgi:hypothetical protein
MLCSYILVRLTRNWTEIVTSKSKTSDDARAPCSITFSEDEASECLRLHAAQIEADKQLQACRDVVGVGTEGWVPVGQYDETKQRESKLKSDALEAAGPEEERQKLRKHWIFDDFDEEEYS